MPPTQPRHIRSILRCVLELVVFGSIVTSCARPLAQSPTAQRENVYLKGSAVQERKWKAHALTDYVFVVEQNTMVESTSTISSRVAVVGGRVQSSSSLLYGGSVRLDVVVIPTIDGLFEAAQRDAAFGDNDIPYVFQASYDPTYGFPLHIWVDGRSSIADDESGFDVVCFSTDPSGCAPLWLSGEQCVNAGARIVNRGLGQECGANSTGSIGIVSSSEICCRDWQPDGTDGITAEQCAAAGGQLSSCGPKDVHIGTVLATEQTCCRAFVR